MMIIVLNEGATIDGVDYPEGSIVQVPDSFDPTLIRTIIQKGLPNG